MTEIQVSCPMCEQIVTAEMEVVDSSLPTHLKQGLVQMLGIVADYCFHGMVSCPHCGVDVAVTLNASAVIQKGEYESGVDSNDTTDSATV
jgi:uncharacterized Zn finger protein (UPF0148 family)